MFALVLYCSLAVTCLGAKTPRLRFTTSAELPDLALKIRLMPNAKAVPLPAPTVYPYVARESTGTGDAPRRIDMYDPYEVWRIEQNGGLWTDDYGNVLVIAALTEPFPGVSPNRRHMTREEYDRRKAAARKSAGAWTQDRILQWVTDFTGATKAEAEAIKRPPFNLAKLLKFTFHGIPAQKLAYAFQMKRRTIGSRQSRGETWVFAIFNLNPMVNVEAARQEIRSNFLPSIITVKAPIRPGAQTGPEPKTHKATPPGSAPNQYEASRKRVADSIRNLENWWYEETPNYIILSNLRKRHRVMVRHLRTNIEIMRNAYTQLVPPRRDIASVSVIRIFATPEEYETFVGPDYRWTGGLWMSNKKELVIRPIDWGGSRDQRDRVLSVAYHEGFHQYLAHALDENLASPWFNEGHAALFEAADLRGTRLQIPENQDHVKPLELLAKAKKLDVRPILPMDYARFYAGTDDDRRRNYALAWGLIYYLRKAAPALEKKQYLTIADRYCEALVKTGHPTVASALAFKDVDLAALNGDLTDFWNSRGQRRRAERNRIARPPAAAEQ